MSIFQLSRQISRLDEKSRERKHFGGDFRCNCRNFQSLEELQAEIRIHREKGFRIFVARDIEVSRVDGKPFVVFANNLLIPEADYKI